MFFQYQAKDNDIIPPGSAQIYDSTVTCISTFDTSMQEYIQNDQEVALSFYDMAFPLEMTEKLLQDLAANNNLQKIFFNHFGGPPNWCNLLLNVLDKKTNLSSLSLQGCDLNIGDAKHIAQFLAKNQHLRYLNLEYINWKDENNRVKCDVSLMLILQSINENKVALHFLKLQPNAGYSTFDALGETLVSYCLATVKNIPSIINISLELERFANGEPDGAGVYSPKMRECLNITNQRRVHFLTSNYWSEDLILNQDALPRYCLELRRNFDLQTKIFNMDGIDKIIPPDVTQVLLSSIIKFLDEHKYNIDADGLGVLLDTSHYISTKITSNDELIDSLTSIANAILNNILLNMDSNTQDNATFVDLLKVATPCLRILGANDGYLSLFARIIAKKYGIDEEKLDRLKTTIIEIKSFSDLIALLDQGLPEDNKNQKINTCKNLM